MGVTGAFVGSALCRPLVKASVLGAALALLATSAWSASHLTVKLDYLGFLPSDSPLQTWHAWHAKLFPRNGEAGRVYLGGAELATQLPGLDTLLAGLVEDEEQCHVSGAGGWWPVFRDWAAVQYGRNVTSLSSSPTLLSSLLSTFLFSPAGSQYRDNFKFAGPLRCGQPAPQVRHSF